MKLRAAAESAGVKYRVATTAGTRFGSKLPFLAELSAPGVFDRWKAFAHAHPPTSLPRAEGVGGSRSRRGRGGGIAGSSQQGRGGRINDRSHASGLDTTAEAIAEQETSRYSILLENMDDVFTRASIIVLHELVKDIEPLLIASQCSVRTLPFDFWHSWDAAETIRISWYKSAGIKLDSLMTERGIELDTAAREKLVTTIEYAVEQMDEKVDSHLMEITSEVSKRQRGLVSMSCPLYEIVCLLALCS
jgi:hypothetical protein